jgi:hypothetical protein
MKMEKGDLQRGMGKKEHVRSLIGNILINGINF